MKKITGNTIVGFLFAAAAGITLYISNATLKSASAMGVRDRRCFRMQYV